MKNMSCFCASNTSGDSVYSGYFRWRMGLPLPPIPQEEEANIIKNTNTEIFNDIAGVKNVNDLTIEDTDVDNTPRRFRRRKNNQFSNNSSDKFFVPSTNAKHFRENPIYINSSAQNPKINSEINDTINSSFQFCPIKDEIFVPSKSESFFDNFSKIDQQDYYSTKLTSVQGSISSFLVNKFLSNVQEFSDSFSMDYCAQDNTQLRIENSDLNMLDNIVPGIPCSVEGAPPAVPPHRKPSMIIEESESECGTVKSEVDVIDKDYFGTLKSLHEDSEKMTTPIPIYSIKHRDIDKIISEGISDYDYAYNKSWSKGVELNLALNLTEDKKSKKKIISTIKIPVVKDENVDVSKEECTISSKDSLSKIAQDPLNVSLTSLTDETDDSTQVNSLPQTSPIPFLKLSSIEADALKHSPTKLSRNSQLSGSFAESETDSRSEPWDVIHGRFVKELTGSRFIDLSVINNNKPSLTKGSSTDNCKSTIKSSQKGKTMTQALDSKKSKDSLRKFHVNIDPTLPLEKQPWYHFYLTRSKSEGLLANHQNGSFLVRRSESNKNDYSLTIKHNGVFLHMKITKNEKGFVLGEYSQPYPSIPHMLYHYCLTMVPVKGAEAACLRFAVTKDHL